MTAMKATVSTTLTLANETTGTPDTSRTRDTAPPAPVWNSQTARCTARWGRAGVVMSVQGEVDAANSAELVDYLQRCSDYCQWLVLDLNEVKFIGISGLSALLEVDARCDKAEVCFAVVPGPAVSRLLGVCGPDIFLPLSESVSDALTAVLGHR
jgi:anti-anti-sigma factor